MKVNWTLIGKRIKHRRIKLKLTQEQLAEKVKKSNIYICRIESGAACPTLIVLLQICKALGCSISYLVEGKELVQYDPHAREIYKLLDGCSPYKIQVVSKVVKSIIESDIAAY